MDEIGFSLVTFLASLFRSPSLGEMHLNIDAEEAEEQGLLAGTGRRFGATWQDITGRAGRSRRSDD